MPSFLPTTAVVACLVCLATVSRAQVVFNDAFNGTNVTTNNGVGAVNPTASTTVFTNGINNNSLGVPVTSQNAGGAYFNPPSTYGGSYLTSDTGNATNGTAYALSSKGTSFAFTVNNVSVSADNTSARNDVPNSGNGGFRFELGLASANTTAAHPELYTNAAGGLYLSLFYDKEGVLSGDLRATDDTKPANADSSGTTGLFELASFTIPQPTGTTSSYTTPLTATLLLTGTSYAISFNEATSVSSGSLSGTFTSKEQGDLAPGVELDVLGQGFNNGDGSGNLSAVQITNVPESSTLLMGGLFLGTVAVLRLARRPSRRLVA